MASERLKIPPINHVEKELKEHMNLSRSSSYSLPESRVTPDAIFWSRREFLKGLALAATGATLYGCGSKESASTEPTGYDLPPRPSDALYPPMHNGKYQVGDRTLTPSGIPGRYNNFYEFTTDKADVARLAAKLTIDPWTIAIGGLVQKPFEIGFEDLVKRFPLEERVYRMRCVEAWSMVVPWIGFPFQKFVELCQPLSSAKYVRFLSFRRPQEAVGQREEGVPWPYYEGLRLDEATNELALMTTGIYGKPLPKQHGAPVRLIIPWKYGYKSPKSIMKIEFVTEQPRTFWNDMAPNEYSFLSNVDPDVPHPRWSQATERDIGTGLRIPTLKYNGYGEFMGSLYA
jgi:sulfoxide reductase catalytic subunit YedY